MFHQIDMFFSGLSMDNSSLTAVLYISLYIVRVTYDFTLKLSTHRHDEITPILCYRDQVNIVDVKVLF